MASTPQQKLLKWIREESGFTHSEIAAQLNKDFPDISKETVIEWETGNSKPPIQILCGLAEIYNTELIDVELSHVKKYRALYKRFDAIPKKQIDKLPQQVKKTIHQAGIKAKRLNAKYKLELLLKDKDDFWKEERQQPPIIKILTDFKNDAMFQGKRQRGYTKRDARELALEFKIEFLKNPFLWDTPIGKMIRHLQYFGVNIFRKKIHELEYTGIFVYDCNFPITVINANSSKDDQIYAIFHNIGRFFRSQNGITYRSMMRDQYTGYSKRCENFCDYFADYLMENIDK